jgi:hypothetical protein
MTNLRCGGRDAKQQESCDTPIDIICEKCFGKMNTKEDFDSGISFETKDNETVIVKVCEKNISIKTIKSNKTFNTIYIEDGKKLFEYLKKYYI